MALPLYYRDLGQSAPDRPALALIHGDFSDGEGAWDRQMVSPALLDTCRMIVVDRRGAGRSPREPRPYTIHQEALDVLAALDAAGVRTFHLAGHSYGALIAWELARLAPERVQSLHLVEPPYLALLPGDPDVRVLREGTEAAAARARQQPPEQTAEAFFRALMGEAAVLRIKQKPAWAAIVREAERIGWQQLPSSYPPDCVAALLQKKVRPPVVIYTGGRSHPGLQKVARRLAALVPGSHLVFVPEAGHAVQHAGGAFDRTLLQFIAGAKDSLEAARPSFG